MLGAIGNITFSLANGIIESNNYDKTLKELGVKNNDICELKY
jgi:hypothetical protein